MDTPLKLARRARGVTQQVVADHAGIVQAHYSRIENGEVAPSATIAANLAAFFDGALTEIQILYPERFIAEESKVL